MAVVYATSSQGNYRVKLTTTVTDNGNGTTNLSMTAELQSKGKYMAGYRMLVSVDGATKIDENSYESSLYYDWHTFLTKTWSGNYSQAHQAYTLNIAFSFSGYNNTYLAGDQSASSTTTAAVRVRPFYYVDFNANGGASPPARQTKWYGETLTLSSTKPTKASSSAGSYTVTFNGNNGTPGSSSLTANRTTSYSFSKWNTNSGGTGTNYNSGGSYTANAAATLYAQYTSTTTTASVTLPTATRTGYTFAGWYTAASGGSSAGTAGASYTPSGNVTLYAHWTANTYTITYSKGTNGTGTNTTQTGSYGSSVTLKGALFTRTGYTQTGWATSDGGSSAYGLSASYTVSGNVTLYPAWTANQYAVTYNANGGSGAPSQQNKTYGVDLTLSSTKPTRSAATATYTVTYNANSGSVSPTSNSGTKTTSYTFSTWNTASNGSGTSYASGGKYTSNSAVTLYAQWSSSVTNASVTLPTPTRSNYTFNGWYTASSGGTRVGGGGNTYNPTANITLYAQWSIINYTITYNANGGSFTSGTSSTQTKPSGTNVALYNSSNVTRSNYTLSGWATSSTGSVVYTPGQQYTSNSNASLYAVWSANYTKPKISSYGASSGAPVCYRTNSSGSAQDDGTYCIVKFRYTCNTGYTASSVKIAMKLTTDSSYGSEVTYSELAGSNSKDCMPVYGSGNFSADQSYNVRITVTDSGGTTTYEMTLSTAFFTMDFGAQGKSIGVGRSAIGTVPFSNGQFDFGTETRLWNHSRYPHINFKSTGSTNNGDDRWGPASLYMDAGSDTAVTANQMAFQIYSPTANTSSNKTYTSHYEIYKLPAANIGRTNSGSYDILTTKSAVTVAQGGTGATSAADARTNLEITPANIGAATSSHNHSGVYLSVSGGTATGDLGTKTWLFSNNTTGNGSGVKMLFNNLSNQEYGTMWTSRIANYGGQIYFREYAESSSGTRLSNAEMYCLPIPNQGRTNNDTYDILTTKQVNLSNKASYGAGYANSYLKFYIPHEDSGSLYPVMRIGTGRGNGWCLGTISTNTNLYFVYNDGGGTANTNATWFSLSPGDTRNAGYEIITSRFTASQTSYGIVTTGFQHFGGIKGFNYIYTYGIDGNGGAVRWSTDITGHNASGTITNELFYDTGNATNVTSGIWRFRQYSPNSTASTTTTGKYEDYALPTVTTGRTDSTTYSILTSKSAVTIAQGGTGSTTRLGALRALTEESVGTNAQFFLTITNSWGKGGYTNIADAKTVLGITGTQYGSNHMGWKKVSVTLTDGASKDISCTGVTADSVVQATRVGTYSDTSGGYSTHIGAAASNAGNIKVFSTASGTVTWSVYLWWSKTKEGG